MRKVVHRRRQDSLHANWLQTQQTRFYSFEQAYIPVEVFAEEFARV